MTTVENEDVGKIKIITIPKGSEIYINEELVGKTPALIEDVPPGFYEVALKQAGYEDIFERVFVKAGKTYSISKKLQENRCVYSISSSPSGARVYLDGNYKGETPVVFSADEGKHRLTIEKTGYSTFAKEINATGEPSIVIEEKLHLSSLTYFAAILILLATGIYIKRNQKKLKPKIPKKTSFDRKAIEKIRKKPEKRTEQGREVTEFPISGKKESTAETIKETRKEAKEENEKLQEESSVINGLIELENLSKPDSSYTVKKKE